MKYLDIAKFEPDPGLISRLGYTAIRCIGKDLVVSNRPSASALPQIIINNDQGVLMGAMSSREVIGIIFDGYELSRKVVEKAAETKKPIFLPVNGLTNSNPGSRGPTLNKMRKIVFAAHRLGATVMVISMAESREQLLSTGQMLEVAKLIGGENGGPKIFGGKL